MQQELTFSKKKSHKAVWTWDDIEEKFGGNDKPLSKQETAIYIKRAERQVESGLYKDIGTVEPKDIELYRKAYYKRMGWKYSPLPEGEKPKKKYKRKKLTGWISGK